MSVRRKDEHARSTEGSECRKDEPSAIQRSAVEPGCIGRLPAYPEGIALPLAERLRLTSSWGNKGERRREGRLLRSTAKSRRRSREVKTTCLASLICFRAAFSGTIPFLSALGSRLRRGERSA